MNHNQTLQSLAASRLVMGCHCVGIEVSSALNCYYMNFYDTNLIH